MEVFFTNARIGPNVDVNEYAAQDFEALPDGPVAPFTFSFQTGVTTFFPSIIAEFTPFPYGFADFELLPDGEITQFIPTNVPPTPPLLLTARAGYALVNL